VLELEGNYLLVEYNGIILQGRNGKTGQNPEKFRAIFSRR
jgi:hypothetical protein